MKKLIIAVIGILLLVGLYGIAVANGDNGRMVEDADLYKHQWDVVPQYNLQCKVKAGHRVRVANRINWGGKQLVHLRAGSCDGWTYARNFRAN